MSEFSRLLQYVRPHWATFTLAAIAMVLVAVFETATGALLVPIFNQFSPETGQASKTLFSLQRFVPQNDWYRAWLAIAGMLLTFTLLKGVAEYFSSYLMAKIGQTVVLDLRKQLYDHILSQSTSFFEKHRTNFLVSRQVAVIGFYLVMLLAAYLLIQWLIFSKVGRFVLSLLAVVVGVLYYAYTQGLFGT